jgi:murein hydrolase activator
LHVLKINIIIFLREIFEPKPALQRLFKRSVFCLMIFLFFPVIISTAQNKSELEKKRKQKEQEIEYTKKLIEEVSNRQRESVQSLQILKKQIENRMSLMSTISSEISFLDEDIVQNMDIIESLERDLNNLKEEYARIVRFAYKNRNTYNKLGFIFSAQTFNQSYKRFKLLQNYTEYRKNQFKLIDETQKSIKNKLNELNFQKLQKAYLLSREESEKTDLENDQGKQSQLLGTLKSRERDLRKQLREKERIAEELNRQIEEIIRREIAQAKKTTKTKTEYGLTPEAQLLSLDFEKNRGKLPWPVEKGIISETFGKHEHPTLKGVFTINNGIDIQTNKEAMARAIFDGEVSNVISIQGIHNVVIVRHGEYFTVYSNLDDVFVRKGDKIKTKQVLGKVHTSNQNGNTELHLEIWKNTTKLDPATWLNM